MLDSMTRSEMRVLGSGSLSSDIAEACIALSSTDQRRLGKDLISKRHERQARQSRAKMTGRIQAVMDFKLKELASTAAI